MSQNSHEDYDYACLLLSKECPRSDYFLLDYRLDMIEDVEVASVSFAITQSFPAYMEVLKLIDDTIHDKKSNVAILGYNSEKNKNTVIFPDKLLSFDIYASVGEYLTFTLSFSYTRHEASEHEMPKNLSEKYYAKSSPILTEKNVNKSNMIAGNKILLDKQNTSMIMLTAKNDSQQPINLRIGGVFQTENDLNNAMKKIKSNKNKKFSLRMCSTHLLDCNACSLVEINTNDFDNFLIKPMATVDFNFKFQEIESSLRKRYARIYF